MKKVLTTLFLCCLIIAAKAQNNQSKNILFLAVDDLKPLLNSYGYDQMHTPNFDRLAKRGTQFTNANVQYAVCGPSRASVMTAATPDHTKVWDLHTDFRESSNLMSMPEYLITQGYETTAVGKIYHKGSSAPGHDGKSWSVPHTIPDNFDAKYGEPAFSYYQNPETKAAMAALEKEGAEKNGKKNQRNYVFKRLKPSTESANVPDEAYQDGLYTAEAIKKMTALAQGDKPWFLGIGWQKPHLPFVAPQKYWDLYDRDKIDLAVFRGLSDGTPKIAYHSWGELRAYSDIGREKRELGEELPEAKQRELIHGYMACVSYIDAQLGKVLDALDAMNLTDKTVIGLWGDHGFHLGDHALWCKHSNFEQATRIPLMFAGPGVAAANSVAQPVELVDMFPTLFELAGVKIPAQADGKSLVPLMDDNVKTGVAQDYAVSQYQRRKNVMGYSVRTERYRYTEWHGNGYTSAKPYDAANIEAVELYDYEKDPTETRNWADDQDKQETVKLLKARIQKYLQENREGKPKMQEATLQKTGMQSDKKAAPMMKTSSGKSKKPNILFIHTDDLGYHDLSFTGSDIYQTPNIDKLAAAGVTFERAYSSYPRCTPSRYGLMTGTYPVNEDHGHLAGIDPANNFALLLKKEGYNNSYVGKWHLGGEENAPKSYGFDHSFAAGHAGGVSTRFYPFNTEKAKLKGKADKLVEDVEEAGKEGDYISDLMTDETIKFIKNNSGDQPFFAMLAFYAVHTPLEAKPEDKKRNAAEIAAYDYGDTPAYIQEGEGRRKMRQDDADYAGMVENVDENVGRLLQTLRDLGIDDNTIIVFSSDHGGLSNDGNSRQRHLATTNFPLKAGKGHLYEGGIRVPLILRYPGKIKPSVDEENIILGMDVLPTVIDLATGAKAEKIDGESYVPVMQGKADWSDRTVFWHSRKARPHSTGDSKCSVIRKGDYKLMHFYEDDRVELYNTQKDVSETENLAEKKPDLVAEMMKELTAWKEAYLVPEKMDMKRNAKRAKKGK